MPSKHQEASSFIRRKFFEGLRAFQDFEARTEQLANTKEVLGEKSEAFFAENHFYVMVDLGDESERPSYHVVPSKIVAATIKKSHSDWLKAPSASGKPRKDSQIRKFSDKTNTYLERWELLGLGETPLAHARSYWNQTLE